jgi:hypothetical protein
MALAGPGAAGALAAKKHQPKPKPPAPPTISPAPGTPDASPGSQISILGVRPSRIIGVSVDGSASGGHGGTLRPYSGDRGASFLLNRPFIQGEQVTVLVSLRGQAAARSSFTVARLAPIPPILDSNTPQPNKLDHFVTEPTLLPPRIRVNRRLPSDTGDIFLTPLPAPEIHPGSNNELTIRPVGPGGPMIIDGSGRLIWFDQLTPPTVAANFRLQRLFGHRVLTWWQGGVSIAAFGLGVGVIANTHYRTIETVRTGNGYQADIHEFLIAPWGDALFTVYSPVLMHVPGTAPGVLTTVLDSIIQEVDIRTGLVVWEWHALGNIPLGDSYATAGNSAYFDAFHLNSIQALPGNRLLVSARDTSAVYEISRTTGRILWTLGGKASTFHLAPVAQFHFQHDAQMLPGNRVSLFDDGAGPPVIEHSSRGVILALNLRKKVATLTQQYRRPGKPTLAESEGNLQTLPGGDVFAGFGATPYFSQFSPSGRMVFNGALPADDGSYRVFRFGWDATPSTKPLVVARRLSPNHVVVYVSWNGANTIAHWQVLAGASPASLKVVKTVPDQRFETRIDLGSVLGTTFAVRGLGAHGRALGRSLSVTATP